MPRDWQGLVAGMPKVQQLVHFVLRFAVYEVDRLRGELLREGRSAYEAELTRQARLVGCRSRRGSLGGASLERLAQLYQGHAEGIVNTYNYDLAGAIIQIGSEVPTANRHVYASRLRGWEARRAAWKTPQIAQSTVGYAVAQAQQDFYRYNRIDGVAVLRPQTAACPVCAGWVARGEVSVQVATNNPPPYHPNCPHAWRVSPGRVSADGCRSLWMGG